MLLVRVRDNLDVVHRLAELNLIGEMSPESCGMYMHCVQLSSQFGIEPGHVKNCCTARLSQYLMNEPTIGTPDAVHRHNRQAQIRTSMRNRCQIMTHFIERLLKRTSSVTPWNVMISASSQHSQDASAHCRTCISARGSNRNRKLLCLSHF